MNVVIVNCFDTYENRVNMLYDVLVSEGHKVTVIASDFRHFKKTYITESKKDYVYVHACAYKKNLSVARLKSHHYFSKNAFEEVEKLSPDLLYVLIPANSLAKGAGKYKKAHPNVKLIFDIIDLWPETMPVGKIKEYFPFTLWKNVRDKYLDCADFIVTECNLFKEKLSKVVKESKMETVYFAAEPYNGEIRTDRKLPSDKLVLCYLGSINNIIDIDVIKEIIEVSDKEVEVNIIGDGERKEELIKGIEEAGGKVIFHGKVYDDDKKYEIMSKCHYGLNIMKNTVCVGLTMKSVEYFRFELPIINNIEGDTWKLVDKYKLGINYSFDKELSSEMCDIVGDCCYENVKQFFNLYLSKEYFDVKIIGLICKFEKENVI